MNTDLQEKDPILLNVDIEHLNNLLSGGINALLKSYQTANSTSSQQKGKTVSKLYTLLYLSSDVFKVINTNQISDKQQNDEIGTVINILKNDIDFITYLLDIHENYIENIQNSFIDNIINIVFTLELKDKITIYTKLFEIERFRTKVLKDHWLYDRGDLNEIKSLLGNMIGSVDIQSTEYEIIITFIENICIKLFKDDLIQWFESMLVQNYKYLQTVSTIQKDKNLPSYEFQMKFLTVILNQYKNARLLRCKALDSIQLDVLYYKDLNINWEKQDRCSCFKWKDGELPDISLFTRLFIISQKLIELSVLPVIDKINHAIQNKTQLNDYIKLEENSVRWSSSASTMKKLYMSSLEKQRDEYQKTIDTLKIFLNNNNVINLLLYFINDTSRLLLKTINTDNNPIPKSFIENISIIIEYMMNTIYKSIIPDNTLKLIELSMLIIRNEFPDINSHTKVRFLKFLTTNNIYINQILSYESKNISLESYIKSLTSFYIQIDKEGEEAQYYDKMPVRYSINNVFVYFINISPYHNDKTTYNIDIYNALESDKNFEKFLYILISDCIHYIEEIIASITKIKQYENINVSLETQITNEEYLQKEVAFMFSYCYYLINNLKTISLFCPFVNKIGLDSIIWEKLVQMINISILKTFNTKDTSLVEFDFNKYEISYKWSEFYNIYAQIYLQLYNKSEFINAMANPLYCYNKDCVLYLIKQLPIYGDDLHLMISNIEQLRQSIEKIEYKDDLPSDFCDPLLYTPIEDPVILPESKIFMDRKSILNHLLHDESDPFNRTSLTRDELEDHNNLPENKEKIKEFLEKLDNWKSDNICSPKLDVNDADDDLIDEGYQ